MRVTTSFPLGTLRDTPSEAEIISHQLLLKAVYIRRVNSGIYAYMPIMLRVIEKISTILPDLEQNIDHKEIGTPKTHKKFLGRYEGSYGPIPSKKLLGLLPMPFNTTKIKNLYCVGDSCFPGQGLNAVAFSGYACAHKIGAKLNINSVKLPE